MTKSLLFYDQIIFFLMWRILRLSRVKRYMYVCICMGAHGGGVPGARRGRGGRGLGARMGESDGLGTRRRLGGGWV